MQAVDAAIKNGVDLDGTPIPPKMLELYNKIMIKENGIEWVTANCMSPDHAIGKYKAPIEKDNSKNNLHKQHDPNRYKNINIIITCHTG